jgi:hypothetical protein
MSTLLYQVGRWDCGCLFSVLAGFLGSWVIKKKSHFMKDTKNNVNQLLSMISPVLNVPVYVAYPPLSHPQKSTERVLS